MSTDGFSRKGTGLVLRPLILFLHPLASDESIELIHSVVRKLAHGFEYGVLALLLLRALHRPERPLSRSAAGAFVLSAGYALLDELHQLWVPSRTGALGDVGIDTVGAGFALGAALWISAARRSRP